MSFEPDETYDVYRKTIRRANKEHVCDACKCTIRPGDTYAHVATVFEGSAETCKRCGRCEKIHAHLADIGARHGTYPMERLDCGQSYEDEWGECPTDIQELAFATEDEAGRILDKDQERR